MSTHVNIRRWVAAAVLIGALVGNAAAARLEAQAVRATILGVVRDGTGAAMPGVTVEVKNVGTGVARSVVTNELGRYNTPDLAIGTYRRTASSIIPKMTKVAWDIKKDDIKKTDDKKPGDAVKSAEKKQGAR